MIPRLDPTLGGVERYACTLANGLAGRGARVTVLTARPPEDPAALARDVRVELLAQRTGELGFEAALRSRLARLGSWDAVQGFGATRCHTHLRLGGGSHAAFLRAMRRYAPGWRRLVQAAHPRHHIRMARQRALVHAAGVRLVANSERVRCDVIRDLGLPPERVALIYNGVDLERFRPRPEPGGDATRRLRASLGIPEDALPIAFVGSGFARKGLYFALQMVAGARARGCPALLLVAGRGAVAPYRRRARRLGIEPAVRFLGLVKRIEDVYAACAALLLPSLYEPFGNAALEAMASGLPVVVPAASGIAELIRDGREGCVLEHPDRVERGAAFLSQLARDPQRRRELGRRARATAETLGLQRNTEAMLAWYREGGLSRGGGEPSGSPPSARARSAPGRGRPPCSGSRRPTPPPAAPCPTRRARRARRRRPACPAGAGCSRRRPEPAGRGGSRRVPQLLASDRARPG